jgi:hypothetical protein
MMEGVYWFDAEMEELVEILRALDILGAEKRRLTRKESEGRKIYKWLLQFQK